MNIIFKYDPNDRDAIVKQLDELAQQVQHTQENPTDKNFNWIKTMIHEIKLAVQLL